MTDDKRQEIIVAANRYVEGGRRDEAILKTLAEAFANAKNDEERRELIRLVSGKPSSKKPSV